MEETTEAMTALEDDLRVVNAEHEIILCCAHSQRKVRVDLHSYDSDAVMIQDYGQQKTTIVTPANSTDPNGSCTVSRFAVKARRRNILQDFFDSQSHSLRI